MKRGGFWRLLVCICVMTTPSVLGIPHANADQIDGSYLLSTCQSTDKSEQLFCMAFISGAVTTTYYIQNADTGTRCLYEPPKGVTADQWRDAIRTWLESNPDGRNYPAAAAVMIAMIETYPCKK